MCDSDVRGAADAGPVELSKLPVPSFCWYCHWVSVPLPVTEAVRVSLPLPAPAVATGLPGLAGLVRKRLAGQHGVAVGVAVGRVGVAGVASPGWSGSRWRWCPWTCRWCPPAWCASATSCPCSCPASASRRGHFHRCWRSATSSAGCHRGRGVGRRASCRWRSTARTLNWLVGAVGEAGEGVRQRRARCC